MSFKCTSFCPFVPPSDKFGCTCACTLKMAPTKYKQWKIIFKRKVKKSFSPPWYLLYIHARNRCPEDPIKSFKMNHKQNWQIHTSISLSEKYNFISKGFFLHLQMLLHSISISKNSPSQANVHFQTFKRAKGHTHSGYPYIPFTLLTSRK